MENVTRRILRHLDMDTRRKAGFFDPVCIPKISIQAPKQYEDTWLFYVDTIMWDTKNHVMVYHFNTDRYTEYDYKTHEVVEFELHRSFRVSVHPDYV